MLTMAMVRYAVPTRDGMALLAPCQICETRKQKLCIGGWMDAAQVTHVPQGAFKPMAFQGRLQASC